MTKDELIDAEAKKRCLRDGHSLDYLACQDRRYRHDNMRPYWDAEYGRQIRWEIARLEEAGFVVTPRAASDEEEQK